MTIITDKMVFGGKCLGKIDGKNVFVPYTIPGEKIEINITEENKDYDNAEAVSIIESSPHRIIPPCHYYGKCGGCNMMHIKSEYQRELRKQMLNDAFLANKIELPQIQIIYGPDFNYRSRFQFTDGGLCQKNANNVITIDQCLCAEAAINEYLKSTPAENRPKGRTHFFASCF